MFPSPPGCVSLRPSGRGVERTGSVSDLNEPVLILSDLHLGHPASRIDDVQSLRPLIQGAGTVVFNGDTWQELAKDFRPRSEQMLAELKALCADLGAGTIFLSGNHDPGWPGRGWLELAHGKIIVTHGDAVMWAGSPWSREAFQLQKTLLDAWEEHRAAEDDAAERLKWARRVAVMLRAARYPRGRKLWRRFVDAVNPPRRAVKIMEAWLYHAWAADSFAQRYFPESECLIAGHFHSGGCWSFPGRVMINTGAFVAPHSPGWVELHQGWLRYGRVGKKQEFTRGNVRQVWRFPSQ